MTMTTSLLLLLLWTMLTERGSELAEFNLSGASRLMLEISESGFNFIIFFFLSPQSEPGAKLLGQDYALNPVNLSEREDIARLQKTPSN